MKAKHLKVTIRKAKTKDIPQVISLLKGLVQYHHELDRMNIRGSQLPNDSTKRLSQLIRARKRLLVVAEIKKRIVGYFVADIRKPRMRVYNKIGYISDGFVEKKYRGKGIGKSLLKRVTEWFLEHNIHRVELMVDTNNASGIKAWQKLGFKEYQKKMQRKI